MAFEPGGVADKLGNRYEGRWVVKQLLRVLNEGVQSVTVEAVGDDQEGVDLWVEQKDGTHQAQQCKARNSSREAWRVSDLHTRGILAKMRFQLDRDPRHEYALVSAIPVSVLGDICESARMSDGDPERFYEHQIRGVGQARRDTFKHFCQHLDLELETVADRAIAYDYLRRTFIHIWADDRHSREDLFGWAATLVTGEPEVVVAALADLALNSLHQPLRADGIRDHLTRLGLHPRELAYDERIAPAVEKLQRQFAESIAPMLVAGSLIPRDETEQVLTALKDGGVVVLHGAAGYGKSGVLYELTHSLREQEVPYLPIRLDRREPRNTPKHFGQDMGLPESPGWCLTSLAGDRKCILILDQLDALRWTAAHSSHSLEVCKEVVRETQVLKSMGKPISVILACRTFDLEHDPEIRGWLKHPSLNCHRIAVKGLSKETVQNIVAELPVDFATMSDRQREILRSPQHLAMWVEMTRADAPPAFLSGTQLMREFWRNRYRVLEENGIPPAESDSVLNALVNYMEQNSRISAPERLVRAHVKTLEALSSLGVIQTSDGRISFCHQSYLDFLVADRLPGKIDQGEGSIRSWLGTKDKQSLFRREQLRQVLSLLCDESPASFLTNVRDILSNGEIRFHLKHLTLELMGEIEEPSADLCEYLLGLIEDDYWRDHVLEVVCLGHVSFVQDLITHGPIPDWLASEEHDKIRTALRLLQSVNKVAPDIVAKSLRPYASAGDDWPVRILSALCWNAADDSKQMFELRLDLARDGHVARFVDWSRLTARHPVRAIQFIEAVASTWEVGEFQDDDHRPRSKTRGPRDLEQWSGDDTANLKKVAREHAVYTWDSLMPHIERLTVFQEDENEDQVIGWKDDNVMSADEGYTHIAQGIMEMLVEAGKTLAKEDVEVLLGRASQLHDTTSPVLQRILAEVYSDLPPESADEGVRWLLADSRRLSLGHRYQEVKWIPAVTLIKSLSPHCSDELFRQLEETIIHYHAPDEKRALVPFPVRQLRVPTNCI